MNFQVTTFPHHRSLTIHTRDLLSWINELKGRNDCWKKWDGPGFFPHVIIKSRYAREVEKFTGLVQFDIDDSSYLDQYCHREALLASLKNHQHCILAYPSFSDFGVWGVIQGRQAHNAEDYRLIAAEVVENLERTFNIQLDRRISLEPRAFRLVPPLKS